MDAAAWILDPGLQAAPIAFNHTNSFGRASVYEV
jgi:hypothetical protein